MAFTHFTPLFCFAFDFWLYGLKVEICVITQTSVWPMWWAHV